MELEAPKIFEPFNNMDEAAKADAANLTPAGSSRYLQKIPGLKIAKTGVSNRKNAMHFLTRFMHVLFIPI